jgi:hypothetical protein
VYPSWKDKGWIPVAGDGCGNYYVLATRGSGVETAKRPIYFVDTSMDREKPAYVVASDLWHFLRFILRDELGRDYWPFKKYRVLEEDPDLEEAPGAPKPWDT